MKNKSFDKQAEEQQLAWRAANIMVKDKGWQNGKPRDHVLPDDQWSLGVWEKVREPLERYIEVEQIQAHAGKHNLKSSWVQCANTFFPFRLDHNMKNMLASFLTRDLKVELQLDISAIDSIDLEYAAPGKLSPYHLLGEQEGKRGSGQTSPDVAIQFSCEDGKCGIYLIENKYTEHHFYPCSAHEKTDDSGTGRIPNPNPQRCENIGELLNDSDNLCHQATWGRQYWKILAKHVNNDKWNNLRYCVAMNDGYQLFRQQALSQGIAASGLFDYVISGVAYDERNTELISCLREIGINDFRTGWPTLFSSKSGVIFHCFSHQQFVAWIGRSKSTYIKAWVEYLKNRYQF